MILANSCHPPEQKYFAIRYFFNKLKHCRSEEGRRLRNFNSLKYSKQ
jgi:hypothetical protein